jgi:hypothetical protein
MLGQGPVAAALGQAPRENLDTLLPLLSIEYAFK